MDQQIILAVDDQGKFLEYIPKSVGHRGEGKRHLAITVLLYNCKGQVLLQRRKHKIFDNLWDFTVSTHPLHTKYGDENLEEATRRCLNVEYGIKSIRDLRVLGEFNYFAKYGEYCENEHCWLMIGKYEGAFSMNPTVGYEYKWIDEQEFLKDIEANPQKYTPWVAEGVKILKKMSLG